jgi:hypothetical protein
MEAKNTVLILAAVSALMNVGCGSDDGGDDSPSGKSDALVRCEGINECKGTSECKGEGSSCEGMNECKGMGFITVPADECEEKGGKNLDAE